MYHTVTSAIFDGKLDADFADGADKSNNQRNLRSSASNGNMLAIIWLGSGKQKNCKILLDSMSL